MARNRKRAKERRSRRPASSQVSRPGVATARADREVESPNPLEHATPDVELADAQLAVGRPDLADLNGESPAQTRDEPEEESVIDEPEEKLDEQDFEDEEDFADEAMESGGYGGGAGRGGGRSGGADGGDAGGGGELAAPAPAAPAQRRRPGNRLINFLQGSWRELQRVQWPDRRQVMQATGVVVGFVIVAGVYLGVADELASKLVTFILK